MVQIIRNLCTLLSVVLLVTSSKCANPELDFNDLNVLDFKEILEELFPRILDGISVENITDAIQYAVLNTNDFKCVTEMSEIAIALRKRKFWAIKLVDAWGKLPSGVLTGNLFELGEFSQCFHIEKDGEMYKSQYCLGQVTFEMGKQTSNREMYRINRNFLNIPNVFQSENESMITPRIEMPAPSTSGMTFTIGTCLPATCSAKFFNCIFDRLPMKKVSIQIPEPFCQAEENFTEITTIDIVTIVLFAVVLVLIVASTSYDILMTINNRDKSQVMLTFSFYTNGMKLLSYKKNKTPDMMNCLHGIRVISTQWVVIGHVFIMYLLFPIRNRIAYITFLSKYENMIIVTAVISVDTFFFLSGLLVAISLLKHLEKTNGKINVLLMYIHRYLRLTPLLVVSILFSITLLRFLGNGPMWQQLMDLSYGQCERYWWSTLLYVQNYVNPTEVCFGHSWYLSVDMQLFLISPAVVYLLYRFKGKAFFGMIILILGCIGGTIAAHEIYNITSMFSANKIEQDYFVTHTRFSPWLIGILGGYIIFTLRKGNRSVRIPKILNLLAWMLSLAIMATVIFGNYPFQQFDTKCTPLEFGLYAALSRVFWAIALFYIVFACIHGYGGPVNWFLSHPLWQPISRLTYAIYLLHFPVVTLVLATMKSPPYFTEFTAFIVFLGCFVLSVFVSIIGSLAFESPMVIIEKMIFGSKQKPPTKTEQTN